jgi:hypothetical protein
VPLHIDEILDGNGNTAKRESQISPRGVRESQIEIIAEIAADSGVFAINLGGKGGEGFNRCGGLRQIGLAELSDGKFGKIHGKDGIGGKWRGQMTRLADESE